LLGRIDEMPAWIHENAVNLIYITLPMVAQPRIMKMVDQLGDTTASIYFVPDIFVFDLIQARFDVLDGIPVVAICESPFSGFNSIVKRLTDIICGAGALLLLWPVMAAIAIGIKATSSGPILFRQRRYGLDGAEIMVYKFRSMNVLEDGQVIRQARRGDNRITPFGAFLRRTSLDELPQLINVLRGDMSLVGPRPERPPLIKEFRKSIPKYMLRQKVKAGMTGWAQVNGWRGNTSLEQRIEHDIDYIEHWSLGRDLKILALTLTRGFLHRNVGKA